MHNSKNADSPAFKMVVNVTWETASQNPTDLPGRIINAKSLRILLQCFKCRLDFGDEFQTQTLFLVFIPKSGLGNISLRC